MTKPRKRIVTDPRQMSLLDHLQKEKEERQTAVPGWGCISSKFQSSIKQAMKNAPKSREVNAEEMSDLLGTIISVHQLNNYAAESHPHRIPAEILPAFCQATGSIEPLRILAEAAGVHTLPGIDALRAEVQKKREAKRKIEEEIRRCETFLREMGQE